jgi:hypothetical protein
MNIFTEAQLFIIGTTQVSVKELPQVAPTSATIQTILTIVFTTMGAISLVIVTIAGFRYIVSRGSAQEVAKAKNTIVYALIGLIVSLSAGLIVRFVLGEL